MLLQILKTLKMEKKTNKLLKTASLVDDPRCNRKQTGTPQEEVIPNNIFLIIGF
jgi:hypothetical protein